MFRQAVDSEKRSGHGRVILLCYELCAPVWGGSPATEQIEGLESMDLTCDSGAREVSCEDDSHRNKHIQDTQNNSENAGDM